ncbi:unnamed protein product [Chondrus crispus]|uniref:Uncharacterized protein n=1 Tax=Chondrus crispus TaxID=2769 RepID=R7QMB3_CHOCR|nr:unnamed protein product [Chondrus crispus]CDF39647.1 unnamed protein product [Chondrus crispus]|eukprot:XP_005709941.1 unnamed protein product [Chondrus crispus]
MYTSQLAFPSHLAESIARLPHIQSMRSLWWSQYPERAKQAQTGGHVMMHAPAVLRIIHFIPT